MASRRPPVLAADVGLLARLGDIPLYAQASFIRCASPMRRSRGAFPLLARREGQDALCYRANSQVRRERRGPRYRVCTMSMQELSPETYATIATDKEAAEKVRRVLGKELPAPVSHSTLEAIAQERPTEWAADTSLNRASGHALEEPVFSARARSGYPPRLNQGVPPTDGAMEGRPGTMPRSPIRKMTVLRTSLVLVVVACSKGSTSSSTVSLLTYENSLLPDVIKGFQDANPSLKLQATTFTSEDDAIAKLQSGATTDVVYACLTDKMDRLASGKLWQPIDTGRLTAWKTLFPYFGNSSQ